MLIFVETLRLMKRTLIKNARTVSDGQVKEQDILIEGPFIVRTDRDISPTGNAEVIDAVGKYLLPGVIDDQVHFRDPGLTYKGDIRSESRAAAAGGVTSFMDMPNTNPQTLTNDLLDQKFAHAAETSLVNYSFMLGASNDNLEEIRKTDPKKTAAVKVFMGSSTGNMLVDDDRVLEDIFRHSPVLIATHCEDEATIRANLEKAKAVYGDRIPVEMHPVIRSAEACFISSQKAVSLARKTGARLHIFHLSTDIETSLLQNDIPLEDKKITAEVCVHHLLMDDTMYPAKGNRMKWNPSIKSAADRAGLWKALLDGRIDVVATDHAPHTLEEKSQPYLKAPSGGPFVQHSLPVMLEFVRDGKLSVEQLVEKMCHNPARLYRIDRRGYIREGYYADLALVEESSWTVNRDNLLYKCGWSPIEGTELHSRISRTFVNGNTVYAGGRILETDGAMPLFFNR